MRPMLASLVLLVATSSLPAQDKTDPPTVSYHGNSFFIVRSAKGPAVAFDPHLIPSFGRPEGLKADVVLLSHLHNDHTNIFALDNAKMKGLKILPGLVQKGKTPDWNPVDETIGDLRVRSVPLYHDSSEGMTRGKNSAFILEMDGWRFCHLGDLGHQLTDAQLKRIGEVDVLMVPVGGIYTLNGSEARRVVQQIQPKEYIFPMHYGVDGFDEVLTIDEFLEEIPRARLAVSDDNRVTLNRDPQRPRPLVVQLHYAPKKK